MAKFFVSYSVKLPNAGFQFGYIVTDRFEKITEDNLNDVVSFIREKQRYFMCDRIILLNIVNMDNLNSVVLLENDKLSINGKRYIAV